MQKGITHPSPGTKRIVGLFDSSIYHLVEISLQTSNEFEVIMVTGKQQKVPLSGIKILLTVMALTNNSGKQYNDARSKLYSWVKHRYYWIKLR